MRNLEEFLYKFKDDEQVIPHSFTNKIKNFSPKSKESRNIIMKINKANIIKKIIGIISTLALTSSVVIAGNKVYENVWKEPKSYKITNDITEEEINESISEEDAKKIVMDFFRENGIEKDVKDLELVKDTIQDEVIWDISFNDGTITLDSKGNISYLNIPTWNYKIPKKYAITKYEARKVARELLEKYNPNNNSDEYELVTLHANGDESSAYIWYADFYKKYGDLINKYESISIGWIPTINGLYSLGFENSKYENNEQLITKEKAIEIATEKDKQIDSEKEIKECNAEIRIEKMNTNMYEREKDKDFYKKQLYLNNEGDTRYKTEERVRKVWVVVIKYNTNELPYEVSYYVDATTGEIIGGQMFNYFFNEEIQKNDENNLVKD